MAFRRGVTAEVRFYEREQVNQWTGGDRVGRDLSQVARKAVRLPDIDPPKQLPPD